MGHASVARSLARAARAQLPLERLLVLTDQEAVLRRFSFFDEWMELVPLNSARLPQLDVLLLDTVPFRRAEVVFRLLPALARPWPQIIVGHTGWVPALSSRHIEEWRELLNFLRGPQLIVYHSETVCGGKCHVQRYSKALRISPVHTGLLLPECSITEPHHRNRRFAAVSGGGFAAEELVLEAASLLARLPDWDCDFYVGPYTELKSIPPRMRLVHNVGNLASVLSEYSFSLTRAGYSSCCEHISAGVPGLVMPLTNPEQEANAEWVRKYLRSPIVEEGVDFRVAEAERSAPASFNWASVSGVTR
jgi:hypothetical protein